MSIWQRGLTKMHDWVKGYGRRSLTAAVLVGCLFLWGCSGVSATGSGVDAKFKEQVLQVIRDNPEVILESVRDYQQKQQQSQETSRETYVKALKSNPATIIGQSPTTGAKDGKTLLIEYSDFQCPYCAKAHDSLKQLLNRFPNRLTLVYKHFPLTSIHAEAMPAAKAAWAAGQQGKFWEYHNALFEQQNRLSDSLYKEIAESLKLDIQKFNSDRASAAATTAIEADMKQGEEIGVDGTPFFMIAGEKIAGNIQFPDLEALLSQAKS